MGDMTKTCEVCGRTYRAHRERARYCSTACRVQAHRLRERTGDTPRNVLERELTALLAAVRKHGESARTLAYVHHARTALDAFEAVIAPPKPAPVKVEPAAVKVPPFTLSAPPPLAPTLAKAGPKNTPKPARTLLERVDAARANGHTDKGICVGIGLADGSTLSRWRKTNALAPSTSERLADWLTKNGF